MNGRTDGRNGSEGVEVEKGDTKFEYQHALVQWLSLEDFELQGRNNSNNSTN
jgi:hypothetical protein